MPELKDAREELFCREFARTNAGTKSAIRAGYAESGAHVRASNLLSRPRITSRIMELRDAQRKPLEKKAALTREWLIDGMRRVCEDALEAGDRPSAIKSMEMLGRECGVFLPNSKLEVTNKSPLDGLNTQQLLQLLSVLDGVQQKHSIVDVTPREDPPLISAAPHTDAEGEAIS